MIDINTEIGQQPKDVITDEEKVHAVVVKAYAKNVGSLFIRSVAEQFDTKGYISWKQYKALIEMAE